MKLSIVIPAHNEEETLPRLLSELRNVTAPFGGDCEIIVVNDHSKDRTRAICLEHGVRLLDNGRRNGKGNALITGFENAKGDYIVMMDADGSHLPEYIPEFVKQLDQGYGLVIGSRQLGGSEEYTFLRCFGNIILSGAFNVITGLHITDVLNGYKGFHRDVFTKFSYRSAEFEIEIELVGNALKAGYRIGEFACHEKARAGGEAKSRVVRHGTRFLLKILQVTIPYRLTQTFKPRPA
jgi:glycosyltransferase involved in cell wall biosynthesis